MISSRWPLAAFMLFSQRSYACAVCGFGESSRLSFLAATAILTLVPLIVIGGIFYFVYKNATAGSTPLVGGTSAGHSSNSLLSPPDEPANK